MCIKEIGKNTLVQIYKLLYLLYIYLYNKFIDSPTIQRNKN